MIKREVKELYAQLKNYEYIAKIKSLQESTVKYTRESVQRSITYAKDQTQKLKSVDIK